LFTGITPTNRNQSKLIHAFDIDEGKVFAVDHADHLVSILTINRTERWKDLVPGITKNPHPERQPQPVLEAVGFILSGIEFELYPC